jgi:hypothetical protein
MTEGDRSTMSDEPSSTTKARAAAPEHNAQRVFTADDRRAEVEHEYSQYVAVVPISFSGVPAFNIGDPVPASHVERGIVRAEEVAKRDTKAALKAAAIAGGLETGE